MMHSPDMFPMVLERIGNATVSARISQAASVVGGVAGWSVKR